jgi:hypothetical protein
MDIDYMTAVLALKGRPVVTPILSGKSGGRAHF